MKVVTGIERREGETEDSEGGRLFFSVSLCNPLHGATYYTLHLRESDRERARDLSRDARILPQ